MQGASIADGDVPLVDRSLTATHGSLMVLWRTSGRMLLSKSTVLIDIERLGTAPDFLCLHWSSLRPLD